ncbi:MAG: SseB family protein [Parasporobacterium sp.]|nr:SseB family protein [Parasporobacterium sp.]
MNFADNYYQKTLVAKLFGKDDLLTVFCAATNMPLVECSEEECADRVFVFEKEENLKEFSKKYAQRKLPLKGILFPVKDKMKFFASIACIGVDELVYMDSRGEHVIPLNQFIRKKDFSNLPREQQPIENPALQLSGIYFLQEACRMVPMEEKKNLKELEEEMAANILKATFILAVEPQTGAESEEPSKTQQPGRELSELGTEPPEQALSQPKPQQQALRIPLVKAKNGDLLQPLFTDHIEFTKYNKDNKYKALAVPFATLDKILAKEAKGYMMNPNGFHLILTREQVKALPARFS